MPEREPREVVARLEAAAERIATPCGDGEMLWRLWGDGHPLVLLHGAFGSWNHWLRNVPELSCHFRVLAPDMPGYGDSCMPPPPFSPEHVAEIITLGLDDILGSECALAMAGFSFGGIIAGHVAARLGDRLTHLVLIGPNGMALPFPAIPDMRPLAEGMSPAEVRSVHRHNLGRLMLADAGKVDDLAVHLQIENARRARFKSGRIPASDSLLRVLPRIQARIAGIWGGADAMAVPDLALREQTLRRFQSDLDFRVIPGAGHWVLYEAPEAVNEAILEMTNAPKAPASTDFGGQNEPS